MTRGQVLLVEGGPGTGKTALGLELACHGAVELGEPSLFLSFEQSPQQLARDAEGLGLDLDAAQALGRLKVIQTAPGVLAQELTAHDGTLMSEVTAMRVRRVVVDGLGPLRQALPSTSFASFRDLLELLIEVLQRHEVTLILTAEAAEGPREERHLCDTLLRLELTSGRYGVQRTLDVLKARGQAAALGRHTLRIEPRAGVRVYPSFASVKPAAAATLLRDPLPSGLDGLDELLGGGLAPGTTTLVTGPAGSGKTLLTLQILAQAAKHGQKGLLVAAGEPPALLLRAAQAVGVPLAELIDDGVVEVQHEPPAGLELDVLFGRLAERLAVGDIGRLAVDPLPLMTTRTPHDACVFIDSLTSLARSRAVAMVATAMATKDVETVGRFVDNVVCLHYVEGASRRPRTLSVTKAGGRRTENAPQPLTLTDRGLMTTSLGVLPKARS